MKKIILSVTMAVTLMFISPLIVDTVQAKDLKEVQDDRKEVKEELTKAEKDLANILKEIKLLNEEITDLNDTLKANEATLDEVSAEISNLEEEIARLERQIAERFEVLKERAKSYQTSGGDIGYLDVILGAKSFTEFVSRVSAVNAITDSDAELMQAQESDKKLVEDHLEELQTLQTELKTIESEINEQKEEAERKKKSLKKKEEEFDGKIKDLKIKDKKLAQIESDVLATMSPALSLSSDMSGASAGTGILGWPTSGGYVSSPMGTRDGRLHKGIDIARTDRSTSPPIFAADSGKVVSAGFDGAYGNKVVIDHGNGMRTLYAHMSSLSVSAGQAVSKGTKLGIMGTTGRSTGIHLHFEVYVNGSLQNPMTYLR